MKKVLLLLVLLPALLLTSCADTPQEAETTTEAPTTTAASGSVVFQGERIDAPGKYAGVPTEYFPVLDDVYLYGELLHRWQSLDKTAKENPTLRYEYDALTGNLQQKGYADAPKGGAEHSGYALADLDGDKIPELLLLNDTPSDYPEEQFPEICAIYAIRNGKPAAIASRGVFVLDWRTVLGADGVFYRCEGWASYEETALSALRLMPGTASLQVTFEARADFAFSNGEVPVPYWTKTENGKEVNISETEFYQLFEEYDNPKERMKLDFVSLHPGKKNPPEEKEPEKPVTPVECPKAYPGAPKEYKPILDDLYRFSERRRKGESADALWDSIALLEEPNDATGVLAYAVADINRDGTPELWLGTTNGLKDAEPLSLFTLKDGKPEHLSSYASRLRGSIAADGIIYEHGSNGASSAHLKSFRLKKNADSLTLLREMKSDFSQEAGKAYFIETINEKSHFISEKTFDDFWELCTDTPARMQVKVYPIVP